MAFVLFDKESTKMVRLMRNGMWKDAIFMTESAAKACITRLKKEGKYNENMTIDTTDNFNALEKYETVISLMTGAPVRQRVNTPRSCDPSTELYWCM